MIVKRSDSHSRMAPVPFSVAVKDGGRTFSARASTLANQNAGSMLAGTESRFPDVPCPRCETWAQLYTVPLRLVSGGTAVLTERARGELGRDPNLLSARLLGPRAV